MFGQKRSVDLTAIKIMINHLIKECYFPVCNLVLLQCIFIPVGIDSVPFWTDLYLYDYEDDFISNLIKTDKSRAINLRMSLPSLMINAI